MDKKLEKIFTDIIWYIRSKDCRIAPITLSRAKQIFELIDVWPESNGFNQGFNEIRKQNEELLEKQAIVCKGCGRILHQLYLEGHQVACHGFQEYLKGLKERTQNFYGIGGITFNEADFVSMLEHIKITDPVLHRKYETAMYVPSFKVGKRKYISVIFIGKQK